jgi:hypothetical protein
MSRAVVHWFYRADEPPLCGADLRPLEPATPFSAPCAECLRLMRQRYGSFGGERA